MEDIQFELENKRTLSVKGAETAEQRAEIAAILRRQHDDWKKSLGNLPTRWKENEALYRNEPAPSVVADAEASATHHMPLYSSKINGLTSRVCQAMSASEPYFIAKTFGSRPECADNMERTVHHFLEVAGFDRKVRESALIAANCGQAFIKCSYERISSSGFSYDADATGQQYGYIGFVLDVIHPGDFIYGPTEMDCMERMSHCGHRLYMTRSEIQKKQEEGVYYADKVVSRGKLKGDNEPGRDSQWDLRNRQAPQIAGDEPIELFTEICKLDLGDGYKSYEVLYSPETETILDIRPYEFVHTKYGQVYFTVEHASFLRSNSVGQDLQGLAKFYDELHNMLIEGMYASAFPPAFVRQGALANPATRVRPGDVAETIGDPIVATLASKFDAGVIPLLIQQTERMAAEQARVDANMLGGQFQGDITATEAAQIAHGSAAGINEYLQSFALGWLKVIGFIVECVYANFDELKGFWQDALPIEDRNDLLCPLRWEVNGKTAVHTGAAMLQLLRGFLEIKEATGTNRINVDELVKMYALSSGLPNSQKILNSDDVVAQMDQQQAQQQQAMMEAQMQLEQAKLQSPIEQTRMRVEADVYKKELSEGNKVESDKAQRMVEIAGMGLGHAKARADSDGRAGGNGKVQRRQGSKAPRKGGGD